MILEGTINQLLGMKEGVSASGNAWKLAEYVLETDGKFPKKIKFDVFGEDRINEMSLIVGEQVRLGAEIESRLFNDKWYTSVRAYTRLDEPTDSDTPAEPVETTLPTETTEKVETVEDNSGLPF